MVTTNCSNHLILYIKALLKYFKVPPTYPPKWKKWFFIWTRALIGDVRLFEYLGYLNVEEISDLINKLEVNKLSDAYIIYLTSIITNLSDVNDQPNQDGISRCYWKVITFRSSYHPSPLVVIFTFLHVTHITSKGF